MSENLEVTLNSSDEFDAVLIQMKKLHDKKRADYSSPEDRFSNFMFAGLSAGVSPGVALEVLIGIKQARLVELFKPSREVVNEPIEDTLLDRAVYSVLAVAYWRRICGS